MNRRNFLRTTLGTAGAFAAGGLSSPYRLWAGKAPQATDIIHLGPDKIKLTRLAIGTGTKGGSIQRLLGVEGLANMLRAGYDQGLFFWDTADSYRTHPHVKEALKSVPREKVTILTKTKAKTADEMRADLDRFRQELGVDYLDIVLLHANRTGAWPQERAGAMDVLSEARQKGTVRTHGISCHSLDAMKVGAKTPWVRVQLARINPANILMDAEPNTVVDTLRQMKAAGQGVIGMKILGEGQLRDRKDEALKYALSLNCVDCFTIGPANREELSDLVKSIPRAAQMTGSRRRAGSRIAA